MTRVRSRGYAYALLLAICFLSRLGIFVYMRGTGPGTDLAMYHGYSHGQDLDQLEYPPLALGVITSARSLEMLLRVVTPTTHQPDELHLYEYGYRLALLTIDLASFGLLLSLLTRLRPAESLTRQIARGLGYVVLGHLQWTVLYDRLDLVVAALLLTSFSLLIGRRPYIWALLVLAVAINLKLIPAVLGPLWVLGSLPPGLITGTGDDRIQAVRLFVKRSAVLVALTVAVFLPLLWWLGPATAFHFVGYHLERGSEVGSLYSNVLLLLAACGVPTIWVLSHHSIEIHSVASPALVALSPILAASAFLIAYGWSLRLLLRAPIRFRAVEDNPRTLAAVYPSEFAGFATLLLMLFMVTSKVFSPQYLIWIMPLLPLAPLGRRAAVLWGGAAAVLATSFIYPLFWDRMQLPGGLTRVALPLFTVRNAIVAFVLWQLGSQLSERFRPLGSPVRSDSAISR